MIRAYATYSKWNDQYEADGSKADSYMAKGGDEMIYGLQFEAWW